MKTGDIVKVRRWTDAEIEPLLSKLWETRAIKSDIYYFPDKKEFRKTLRVTWRRAKEDEYYVLLEGSHNGQVRLQGTDNIGRPYICKYPEFLVVPVFCV